MLCDKEVGELWRGIREAKRHARDWQHPVMHETNQKEQLIRKLVEDRASSRCDLGSTCDRKDQHLLGALLDFNINPEDWDDVE